jgi:hypothetical protein
MGREQFVGSWGLVSAEFRNENGEVSFPLGHRIIGQLMYDGAGNMSAQLINIDRPRFSSGDWLRGTPAEIITAFEGQNAYFGLFDVDDAKGIVTHHVKCSSFPNWVGQDNVRYFQFSDNHLILRTVPMLIGGKKLIGELVWEKTD